MGRITLDWLVIMFGWLVKITCASFIYVYAGWSLVWVGPRAIGIGVGDASSPA